MGHHSLTVDAKISMGRKACTLNQLLFISRLDLNIPQHFIILTALEEMIQERKLQSSSSTPPSSSPCPETPLSTNEYFAAIMTALEAQDQSHTPELVCLLDAVIGHVDGGILRGKFKAISSVLILLLKTNREREMTSLIRDLVDCLGKLLLAQETSRASWSSPGLLKAFFELLSCFKERRPRIRKAAMHAILELLRLHASRKLWVLSKQVSDFSAVVLEGCTVSDSVPTLHLLGFLAEALPLVPEASAKPLVELLVKLQKLDNTLVLQASLRTLRAYVKASESCSKIVPQEVAGPPGSLSCTFLQELSFAVLASAPRTQDEQVSQAFCELVSTCMECLASRGPIAQARQQLFPRAIQAMVSQCEAGAVSVQEAACLSMRLIMASMADDGFSKTSQDRKAVTEALTFLLRLLDYKYQGAWGVCVPFLGSLFIHFKQGADGLLDPLLRKLAFLRDAVATSAPKFVKAFEACVGSAIDGLGIEKVLDVLPLSEPDGKKGAAGMSGAKETNSTPAAGTAARRAAWLLPLLASHGKRQPVHLSFFQKTLLEVARRSHDVVVAGAVSGKQLNMHRQRVIQIWALLPAFCSHPLDVAENFGDLAPVLANALQDPNYPELLFTVCQGLQVLLQSTQESRPGESRDADLEALSRLSKKFLPTLFNILDGCPLDDSTGRAKIPALSETISAYALIAPPTFVSALFKKLVQRMLLATQVTGDEGEVFKQKATQLSSNQKAVILCELALALVPTLDEAGVALLYKVVRPCVRLDRDLALQKRAYRVLGALCDHHRGSFLGSAETREDLVPLLTESLLTCHVSARHMRLRVLGSIVKTLDGTDQAQWEMLASLVGEVLLCLKDTNGKARDAAYEVLTAMALVKSEEEDFSEFVKVVLAALAAETPHMRSAAVLALAHLIFEFGRERPALRATIPDLLSTVLLLGQDPVKEVVKAVVSFVRICVAACPPEGLEPLLPTVLETLFASNSKVRFRAKIKIILKKLCRKFGYERILELAPETDRRLITHIQKQALRGDRISSSAAAAAGEEEGVSHDDGRTRRRHALCDDDEDKDKRFEHLMGDEEEDDEEDGDSDVAMDENESEPVSSSRRKLRRGEVAEMRERRKRNQQGMMVRESGGIVDLLDSSMMRNLKLHGDRSKSAGRFASSRKRTRNESDSDLEYVHDDSEDDDGEILEFNEDGKLLVHDAAVQDKSKGKTPAAQTGLNYREMMAEDAIESDDENVNMQARNANPGQNKRQRIGDSFNGKKTIGNRNKSRKQMLQQQQQRSQTPGKGYSSRKAGGDVKRPGQLEPYAYIPLNAKTLLSKKGRGEAAKSFGAVVKSKRQRKEEQNRKNGVQITRKGGRR